MKNLRFVIVLAVVANLALVAWLLVDKPSEQPRSLGEAVAPLVATNTLEGARYDLSDQADRLNIVLISMDALRYDRTGLAGDGDSHTPNLDSLAEESVVFHKAMSASPWTLPSHMSIWTARWPSVHGVTNKLKLLSQDQMVPTSLSPGIPTYPDLLIEDGWTAAGFTGGAGVQGSYGFGRGFDAYLDNRYFGGLDYSAPAAVEWIREHKDEQFFLFLHGYDVHGQYALPDAALKAARGDYTGELDGGVEENAVLREQGLAAIEAPGQPPDLTDELDEADARFLREVYDRKVEEADRRLGNFLDELRRTGLMDRTLLIVVSDHGDEFMEHGALDHGATLYEEQLHVVMMMRLPGYERRHDIDQLVRTIDLFPTVFDLLGLPGPTGADGVSLLPLMRGEDVALTGYAETDYRLFVHLRAIREGDDKLILDLQDGKKELYDLTADPTEQADVSSANPRETYELEQALRTWMDKTRTNPEDYLGIQQKPITIF